MSSSVPYSPGRWPNASTTIGRLLALLLSTALFHQYASLITTKRLKQLTQPIQPCIEQASYRVWDEQGKASHQLSTPLAETHVDSQIFSLTQPDVAYTTQTGLWKLTAKHATVDPTSLRVKFMDDVLVTSQKPSVPTQITTFTTDALWYDITLHRAYTNHPVVIKRPKITLTAGGLDADLSHDTLALTDHAQGQYEPRA